MIDPSFLVRLRLAMNRKVHLHTFWLMFIVVIVGSALLFAGQQHSAEYWLNRYQTLVAGAFAIVGAYLTLDGVRRQIEQIDSIEKQRVERERLAARAILPLVLSSVCDFCVECLNALNDRRVEVAENPGSQPELRIPAFPANLLPSLQEAIRFSAQPHSAELVKLISEIQLSQARLHSYRMDHKFDGSNVLDLIKIYTRAGLLFYYARGAENTTYSEGYTSFQIENSLRVIGFEANWWAYLSDRIRAAEEHGTLIR